MPNQNCSVYINTSVSVTEMAWLHLLCLRFFYHFVALSVVLLVWKFIFFSPHICTLKHLLLFSQALLKTFSHVTWRAFMMMTTLHMLTTLTPSLPVPYLYELQVCEHGRGHDWTTQTDKGQPHSGKEKKKQNTSPSTEFTPKSDTVAQDCFVLWNIPAVKLSENTILFLCNWPKPCLTVVLIKLKSN